MMTNRTRQLILLVLVAGVASGCATGTSARLPSQSASIKNFQQVSLGVYRGAQPDTAGMRALKELGVKTVVSLRVPSQVIDWEAEQAEQLGLEFISIPIDNYDTPSNREVHRVLSIMRDPAHQPVFVHCRQGQLRTGALVAAYRVLEEGWTTDDAYAEARRYGFDHQYPWHLPLKWFIKDLDRYATRVWQQTAVLLPPASGE